MESELPGSMIPDQLWGVQIFLERGWEWYREGVAIPVFPLKINAEECANEVQLLYKHQSRVQKVKG